MDPSTIATIIFGVLTLAGVGWQIKLTRDSLVETRRAVQASVDEVAIAQDQMRILTRAAELSLDLRFDGTVERPQGLGPGQHLLGIEVALVNRGERTARDALVILEVPARYQFDDFSIPFRDVEYDAVENVRRYYHAVNAPLYPGEALPLGPMRLHRSIVLIANEDPATSNWIGERSPLSIGYRIVCDDGGFPATGGYATIDVHFFVG